MTLKGRHRWQIYYFISFTHYYEYIRRFSQAPGRKSLETEANVVKFMGLSVNLQTYSCATGNLQLFELIMYLTLENELKLAPLGASPMLSNWHTKMAAGMGIRSTQQTAGDANQSLLAEAASKGYLHRTLANPQN